MAIAQTGSTRTFQSLGNSNSGTYATNITIPADTTKAVLIQSQFANLNDYLASATLTKGGVDTAMTKGTGTDFDQNAWMGAMFYMDSPDTGSSKTMKWSWGAAGSVEHPVAMLICFSGTAAGIRDADRAKAAAAPWTTPTLTAQSGDLIVVGVSAFCSVPTVAGSVTASGWTALENVASSDDGTFAGITYGTASPTGNQTVGVSSETGYDDGGIMALVLTPSGGAPTPANIIFPSRRG